MSETLIDNLRHCATRYGGRPAIESHLGTVSYAELYEGATRTAGFLLAQSCSAGARVALVLPNGIEYAIAYYGVLMAGAIAVPMNPVAKTRDYAAWLAHCEPAWVFAESGNSELSKAVQQTVGSSRLVTVGATSVGGQTFDAVLAHSPAAPRDVVAGQPASIVYTSGTTGRPKGVLLSHGNLASNTDAIVRYLDLTANDSIVSVLPFYYSYGSSILHSHLKAGGRVIIEQNFVYPHLVVEKLAQTRASGFAGVPSTYALLLARVKLAQYDLSHLRYVTQAGGAMSAALASRLREALPGVDIFIMYGQTEATARLTYLPPEKLAEKAGSVGVPIAGVRIEVRDEAGRPVRNGQVGEIWAQGPNVMLGYWRDPKASATVLRDGWLKTGDMGYLDADGCLYLVGRRDDMIKVGAHRIYPKDVEDAIAELTGVEEVAVAGVEDAFLGQSIKAFVVPAPGASLDARKVLSHCRERLAAYKVPKQVEIVASLPKTSSGKVLRLELTSEVQK